MIGELYEKQRITITVIDAKRLYLEIFSLHKLSKYHKHLIYCFYSTTKHAILQISNHYLLCSLDPLNLGRLFRVIGPKLINDTEYNLLSWYTTRFFAFKPALIILKVNIDYSLFKYLADLVSLRSISIAFYNLGNIADRKLSRFLFKTRSNLYDFVLFGSARDLNIFWKEEIRLLLKYPCMSEH